LRWPVRPWPYILSGIIVTVQLPVDDPEVAAASRRGILARVVPLHAGGRTARHRAQLRRIVLAPGPRRRPAHCGRDAARRRRNGVSPGPRGVTDAVVLARDLTTLLILA